MESDACLAPVVSGEGLDVFDAYVRRTLDLERPGTMVAILASPSFSPARLLALRRDQRGYVLVVTKLEQDVWSKMMTQMQERQGPVVSLAAHLQAEALADLSVSTKTFERRIDPQTAGLLSKLWQALTARTQIVELGVPVIKLDGTRYLFWHAKGVGATQSPRFMSVLERATSAADRLSRLVEEPSTENRDDLPFIRAELRDALERTRNNEPCTRLYRKP